MSARSPRDFALVLLRRANDDLTAAAEFAANERLADSVIGFHAQQAVEKSLKAVLAGRELEVPRTHDLDLLAERLQADGAQLPVDRDRLNELTAYAGPLRYEELLDPEPLDRQAVTALAREVHGWADAELSG